MTAFTCTSSLSTTPVSVTINTRMKFGCHISPKQRVRIQTCDSGLSRSRVNNCLNAVVDTTATCSSMVYLLACIVLTTP